MRVAAPPGDVKLPEFKAPDIKLDIPDFKVPDFKAPDVKIPAFSMPKIDLPDMPTTSSLPAVSMPKFESPKFDIPKGPSVSMPKLDLRTADIDADVEPQEIRDERAKEARSVYKDADEKAKVSSLSFGGRGLSSLMQCLIFHSIFCLQDLEAKAAALRQVANEKKKVAREAKDAACETRFGGKVLCIRPLNSGY